MPPPGHVALSARPPRSPGALLPCDGHELRDDSAVQQVTVPQPFCLRRTDQATLDTSARE